MEAWSSPDACHGECLHLNISNESTLNITDYNSSVVDDVADIVEIRDGARLYGYGILQVEHDWSLKLESNHIAQTITEAGSKNKEIKPKRKQSLSAREDDQLEFSEMEAAQFDTRRDSRRERPNFMPFNQLQSGVYSLPWTIDFSFEKEIIDRKMSITHKMAGSLDADDIHFTPAEENDILDRAHRFLLRVRPDPAHCKLPSLTTATPAQSGILCESNNNQQVLSQDVSDLLVLSPVCYVVSEASYIKSKDTMQRARLPLGTELVKPGQKLVELVALAIDESPDGVLQVQQVYSYLMYKYPYFAFMDKLSTSSWRVCTAELGLLVPPSSSIRHALYQKWFRKITVCDEKISNKGCFWMINRENNPKEWSLPATTYGGGSYAGIYSPELTNISPARSVSCTSVQSCASNPGFPKQESLETTTSAVRKIEILSGSQPILPNPNLPNGSRIIFPVPGSQCRKRSKRLKPYQVMSPEQMVAWGSNPSSVVTPYQLLMSSTPTFQSSPNNVNVITNHLTSDGQHAVFECQPVSTASADDVNTFTYSYSVPNSVNEDNQNQPTRS